MALAWLFSECRVPKMVFLNHWTSLDRTSKMPEDCPSLSPYHSSFTGTAAIALIRLDMAAEVAREPFPIVATTTTPIPCSARYLHRTCSESSFSPHRPAPLLCQAASTQRATVLEDFPIISTWPRAFQVAHAAKEKEHNEKASRRAKSLGRVVKPWQGSMNEPVADYIAQSD